MAFRKKGKHSKSFLANTLSFIGGFFKVIFKGLFYILKFVLKIFDALE